MVVGGAAGLAGITFPGLELAVAGTLVVLGLLVTGRVQVAESWVPAVALLFGTAHGLAHGGELPSTAAPLAYMVGFVVATVGLHVAGVAGGTALRARPGARAAIGSGLAVTGVGLVLLA
jgi:urease accessory protein